MPNASPCSATNIDEFELIEEKEKTTMGAFDVKADDIIVIRSPKWEPHEECRARTTVLVADEEWVTNQLIKIKQETQSQGNRAFRRSKSSMNMEAQLGAANRLWVSRMLVDWTFTKDGLPMPLTLEAVKQLRQDYLDYIYEQIMAAQPKDEDEETEQGDDGEGEDPTSSDASNSIDGDADRDEGQLFQEVKTTGRNHLLQPPKF